MPREVLPFAYDVVRSFLIATVPGDPRSSEPVRALVAALPARPAASLADMRVLMHEVVRGGLRAFAGDRTVLEPGGFVAIPLEFIARTALDHDGSGSWSPEEWTAELQRSCLWRLTRRGEGAGP